jgi:uncharacterized protein (TIGR04255 family)
MSDRKLYPNAPVVLAVIEVRHSAAEPLSQPAIADLKRHLAKLCPLFVPATSVTLTASTGGMQQEARTWPRYMSRDKSSAVTFRDTAIVVETTRYERYEMLRELAMLGIEGRQRVAPVDGVERVGMRYINEIRVPELKSAADWAEWVAPTLAGPAVIPPPADTEVSAWQGLTVFGGPNGSGLTLRHGPFEGYAVDPGGDLKRPTPTPGPFFLIDLDSYWAPLEEMPDLELDSAMGRLDGLNQSITDLFENMITDRLRDEVLRRAR